MNCPRCQTDNPDNAKFCLNCGSPLSLNCTHCGTTLPAGAKFCLNCGQPVAVPGSSNQPADPIQSRLQKYIPRQLAERMAAASRNEGERRIVTVLFCDVKGSTAMAERLDPEDWTEIMNGAFEYLIAPIYRYEGTVARLMGDAVLAFFGAPIAHEDDPERAVRAALEIVEGIRSFRDQIKRERGLDFEVRVGINTGLVVVGEVGSDLRAEYTAMGDGVNIAARMEQTASPGTIQIAANTYKQVAALFEFEPLGEIEIKGKRDPMPVYRVIGVKAQPNRVRGIGGLETPLVGRNVELTMLRNVITSLRAGHGQIVSLVGEAGLGKSRLVAELRAEWQTLQNVGEWRETSCASYDTARPYAHLRQYIARRAGFAENDPPETIRKCLNEALTPVPAGWRERIQTAMGVLFGLETSATLQGEQLKRELFEVVLQFQRFTDDGLPRVWVFDDLHWGDPASVELLVHLFQIIETMPILFLCAFRPERQAPSWQLVQKAQAAYPDRYTEIVLAPLSSEEGNQLVHSLLNISDLPARLHDVILEKAEGNPFFVEEVVRALHDSGLVIHDETGVHWRSTAKVDDITIPDSLQALITARIDRLEENTRRTLQLAAVIGRSFYYRVLQLIAEVTTQLDSHLRILQRAELIREEGREPELEYVFRHALTQEAAYNSILLKRRRQFHRQVGETLETLFADRIEEYAPVLGHHFYEAGDVRAQKYFALAGDLAYRLYANAEAALHYTHAIEVAKRASAFTKNDIEQLCYLYTRRARALELSAHYPEALAVYQEMADFADELQDPGMEVTALLAMATLRTTPNPVRDTAKAKPLLEDALILIRELADPTAECRVLWNLMLLSLFTADAQQAVSYGEQSRELARQYKLREQLAFTAHDLALCYWSVGNLKDAQESLEEARSIWEDLENLPLLSDTLGRLGQSYYYAGDYEKALHYSDEAFIVGATADATWSQAQSRFGGANLILIDQGEMGKAITIIDESLELAEQCGNLAVLGGNRATLGWIYGLLGQEDRGIATTTHAVEVGRQFPLIYPLTQAILARLHIQQGNLEAAQIEIDEAAEHAVSSSPSLPILVTVRLAIAELDLVRGNYEQARQQCDKLIDHLHRYQMQPLRADALYTKGQALLGLNESDAAYEVLQQARAEADRIGARWMLWQVLFSLSQIEAQRGNHQEAHALHRQACDLLLYIADHIGDDALRKSFLGRAAVRAVLES